MSAKKILVVDDEKESCQFFKQYLTKRGYSVDIAYDGLEAKDLLDKHTYDCIFFDCNMPELSGVELIKVIKEKNPKAKKIMISGYDLINEDFAKDSGVDIFLRKPFSLETVNEIVKMEGGKDA
ncbi:MAG: response regulator [Candidatus Omnitrophica bacterium]|nr:response regulator [Candidatus Omnitrophota bacterium]